MVNRRNGIAEDVSTYTTWLSATALCGGMMNTIAPATEPHVPAVAAAPKPRVASVWLMTAVMIAVAALIFTWVLPLAAPDGVPWTISWWALALGFAAAEIAAVTIRFNQDSHTISLAEIPLVFGLTLAAPVALVVGRVLGSLGALMFYREQPPLKLAFNLALFNVETGIAILVYRTWLGSASPNSLFGWLGALVAVATAVVVSAALVDAVIAIHDARRKFTELVRSFAVGSLISVSVGFLGMVSIALVWHDRFAFVLLAGLVGIFFLLMRVYGAMSRRHDDLSAVHSFTARISRAGSTFEIATTALDECRTVLRSELADLVMLDPDSGEPRRLAVLADGSVTTQRMDARAFSPVRAELEATREPVLFGAEHRENIARYFAGLEFGSGIAVPVESSDELVGVIAVGNRIGPVKKFSQPDIELLKALARQVAVTLERAELIESLQSEISAKEDLIRSKDSLLATVSHEMRTPLTAVLGYAEILGEQADAENDRERRVMVNAIATEATDLGNIVEDLLVSARDELGSLSVTPVLTEVDQTVLSIVEGSLTRSDNIEMRISVARAYCDPQRVRQIVRNLLENARRYGGEQIRVEVDADGEAVHVRICDDGLGVPEEMREEMFAAYKSAHAAGTQPDSVGIGLTVSRRLARMMGGDIVYRREDGWTVFDVTIPFTPERRV